MATTVVTADNDITSPLLTAANTTTATTAALDPFDFVMTYVITPVVCVIGICGNVISLVVFRRQKRSSSAQFLLKALAVYDLLFLLSVVIFAVLHYAFLDELIPTDSVHAVNFVEVVMLSRWLLRITEMGTIYMIVVITIDRFIHIRFPLKAQSTNMQRNAKIGVGVITCLAVAMAIPEACEYYAVITSGEYGDQLNAMLSDFSEDIYYDIWFHAVASTVIYEGLPIFCVIIPLNIALVLTLRTIQRTRKSITSIRETTHRNRKSNDGSTAIIVAMVIVFIVLKLPGSLLNITWVVYRVESFHKPTQPVITENPNTTMADTTPGNGVTMVTHTTPGTGVTETAAQAGGATIDFDVMYIAASVTNLLLTLNSAINVFIYFIVGKSFRKTLTETFCSSLAEKRRKQTRGSSVWSINTRTSSVDMSNTRHSSVDTSSTDQKVSMDPDVKF